MNRAERRRAEKAAGKNNLAAPLNTANYAAEQISKATGARVEQLMIWKEAREAEIRKAAILESQEKLWRAEDYIAVANILITIYALKMSRKSREHTKDLINRMLDNLNPAREYVDRVGVQKAYEQAHEDFGIELEFDSMDLNKEFGFSEHDFREEGFEGKSGIEIWNEAWEDAKDLGNVINTCSIGLVLKRKFGFFNSDLCELIKLSNQKIEAAKQGLEGVTKLINEFEDGTGMDIGKKNKELVKRYGL